MLINNIPALTAAGTTAPTGYTWWATQNTNFLTTAVAPAIPVADLTNVLTVAPSQLIYTDPLYKDPTGPINMKITWTPEILAKTLYHATAIDNTAGRFSTFVSVLANGSCSNNLQVFEIDPKPAFTVDIASIDGSDASLAFGTDAPFCVDVVRSAAYDIATNKVLMDYGTNTLYYEVVSANFVTSWLPTFTIDAGSLSTAAGKDQKADVSWYPTLGDAKAGTNVIETFPLQVDGATIQGVKPLTTAIANTSTGVSVFVKVVIHNYKWESILDNKFTLSVDGKDFTNQWDLDNSTINAASATPTCAAAGPDYNDKGVHTITARPDVIDNSGPGVLLPSFVPKN
ncbi:MAG TPA: hypothetical protein DCL77_06955 [Prolixibacteraceae bacterium]|nr:hypothetical protein [Prolixibacteraceae bacterium]